MKLFFSILPLILFVSCHINNNKKPGEDFAESDYGNIPAERKVVNPNPVKTYSETVKSFATNDTFRVSLFETKETFHYLVKIQYKELTEEDTLKVPNFGIEPSVDIVKGDSIRPSCVIGFLDQDKQFKESKLIYFDDDKLKVHVLKHYAVFVQK